VDSCEHIGSVPNPPPDADGCSDCLAIGSRWVHLRRCLECGHVACCNSSPNKHASAHAAATGHPLVQSFEPGEDWVWCYVDEVALTVPELTPGPSHP
jgi:uncharacterized UBP type Zn finger protein